MLTCNKKAGLPSTKATRLSLKTRGFPTLLHSRNGFFLVVTRSSLFKLYNFKETKVKPGEDNRWQYQSVGFFEN